MVGTPNGVHGQVAQLLVGEDDMNEAALAPVPLQALVVKIAHSWDLKRKVENAILMDVQVYLTIIQRNCQMSSAPKKGIFLLYRPLIIHTSSINLLNFDLNLDHGSNFVLPSLIISNIQPTTSHVSNYISTLKQRLNRSVIGNSSS